MNDALMALCEQMENLFRSLRMTEADWFACENPRKMLEWLLDGALAGRPSDRKLRLFGCACMSGAGLPLHRVEYVEANGPPKLDSEDQRSDREFALAWTEKVLGRPSQDVKANLLRDIIGNPFRPVTLALPSPLSGIGLAVRNIAEVIYRDRTWEDLPILADALEDAGCTNIEILDHLRPVVGKPICTIDTGSGPKPMYSVPESSFTLRESPGPHVRGCWALDLILGKS